MFCASGSLRNGYGLANLNYVQEIVVFEERWNGGRVAKLEGGNKKTATGYTIAV